MNASPRPVRRRCRRRRVPELSARLRRRYPSASVPVRASGSVERSAHDIGFAVERRVDRHEQNGRRGTGTPRFLASYDPRIESCAKARREPGGGIDVAGRVLGAFGRPRESQAWHRPSFSAQVLSFASILSHSEKTMIFTSGSESTSSSTRASSSSSRCFPSTVPPLQAFSTPMGRLWSETHAADPP